MSTVLLRFSQAVLSQEGAEMSDRQLLEDFVQRRDEAAFAALMNAHGPMVLGICKRVLRDHHDAEEAFQATFLILSRKAASIMQRSHIGSWLYSVAYRTALHAQRLRNRRRRHEIQDSNASESVAVKEATWNEIAPLLDCELNSLPEKYRAPLVLCDLEGRTCKDVARELGCPEGTLSGRLMRGRNLLAKRMGKHGVFLSVSSMTLMLTQNAASAAIPTSLMLPVTQAAPLATLSHSLSHGISSHVMELTNTTMKSLFYSTIKQTAFSVVLIAGLGFGAIELFLQILAADPKQPATDATAQSVEFSGNAIGVEGDTTFHYAGTVVDEHGNPVDGAKLWLDYFRKEAFPINRQPLAVTDAQGKFEFSRSVSDFADGGEPRTWVVSNLVIASEGHGVVSALPLDFETTGLIEAELPPDFRSKAEAFVGPKSNVVKLVLDNVPIRGRILDSQKLPIPDAEIETLTVYGGSDGTLEKWEEEATKPGASWFSDKVIIHLRTIFGGHLNLNDVRGVPMVKTDADGYFALKGLGNGRLAVIAIRAPGFETVVLSVRSRPGKIIKLDRDRNPDFGSDFHYPNEFTYQLGPSIPVEGIVTDAKTGLPQANVIVRATRIASHSTGHSVPAHAIHTVSDASGHYRLEGLPLGKNTYELIPPIGSNCENQSITVETNLDSKAGLQVATPALSAGTATGMSKRPAPPQLSPDVPVAPTTQSLISRYFILGNIVLLAGVGLVVLAKRRR